MLAVDVDPTEDAGEIQAYREQQGYPWDMAPGNQEMLIGYGVTTTAKKLGVDRNGIITFTEGYGVKKAEEWEGVFQGLAEQ